MKNRCWLKFMAMPERKFTIYIVKACLACYGYYDNENHCRLHSVVLYGLSIVAGVGLLVNMFVNEKHLGFSDCTQIILYIGHMLRSLMLRSAMVRHPEALMNIRTTALNGIQSYYSGQATTTEDDRLNFKRLFFRHIIFVYAMYFIIMFSPMFYLLSGTIAFPFDGVLLYPSWYPWKLNNMAVYTLTYALEFFAANLVMLPVVANITMLFYFMQEVQLQGNLLCSNLHAVDYRCKQLVVHRSTRRRLKKYQANFMPYFRETLNHHMLLSRFIDNITHIEQWPFGLFAVLGTTFVAIDLNLFFTEVYGLEKLKYFMEAFVVFYYVLIICYTGVVLENFSNNLREVLRDLDWYGGSPEFTKLISILLTKTNRQSEIKFGFSNVASLNYFALFTKITYSYLNIFRQINKIPASQH